MKEFTQAELLNEGLWSSIGAAGRGVAGAVRGGVELGARALDKVAPELTTPWKNLGRGIKDVVAPSVETMVKVWQGRVRYIIKELEDMGYIVKDRNQVKKSGKNYIVPAYKITNYDSKGNPILDKKPSPFLIDRSGTILKNLRNAKPSASVRTKRNP